MTQATTSPTAHLSDQDVQALGRELDSIREQVLADLGEQVAAYIHRVIAAKRGLEAGGRGALLVSLFPPAWLAGTAMLWPRSSRTWRSGTTSCTASGIGCATPTSTRRTGSGTPPRPRTPGSTPQLRAPHLHQRPRQGPRPRLRDPAHRARSAVAPAPPRPAGLHRADGAALRVGDRRLRHRTRERPRPHEAVATRQGRARQPLAQGAQAARQRLRRLPTALRLFGGSGIAGQPHRQRHPQRVGPHDHRVRTLPRRRPDIRRGTAGERDAR
jgi:hypothetical protein